VSRKAKHQPQISSEQPRKERPAVPRFLLGISDTPDGSHPSWRLSLLDLEHAGSWSWNVTATDLQQIATFLSEMERLTWTEIRAQMTSSKSGSHRKHHAIPVESLCTEAQRRLATLRLDDCDELFRFRLSNMQRLWGIVHDGVFYAIWWDPNHRVYPTDPN
jgi:hypothetical protein